ncbi:MAG TPA: DNA polymerase III subunit gamma/tau, partial [Verrucomicrobiae bacterium]|nr:DNA polymerase III subunit gamma/tau [Verrucomicrobiae bacterium]
KDLARLLSDLLNHFRNLLIFQVSRGDLKLLEVSEAESTALGEQSKLADANALSRIMEVLADAEIRLRDAASKKILIEVTLLKAIEARNAVSIDSVLKRLQELRGEGGSVSGASTTPASAGGGTRHAMPQTSPAAAKSETRTNPAPLREESVTAQTAAAAESTLENGDLQTLWAKLLETIGRVSQFTRSYLLEAHPVSLTKNLFTIGFDPEFADHIALVDNARNHTLLQTKLAELGHANLQIKFVKAVAPERPPQAAPAPTQDQKDNEVSRPKPVRADLSASSAKEKSASVPFSQEDFKNDPLIQKALEIFKGQIVEVRA